jgi:hypothetical protein
MSLKLYYFIFISFFEITMLNAQPWLRREKNTGKNETIVIANAVFDEIKIDYTGDDFAEYFIFDMNEKLIRQGWFMNAVPVQYLVPGSYYLTVRTKDKVLKGEFLKLKPGNTMSMLPEKQE